MMKPLKTKYNYRIEWDSCGAEDIPAWPKHHKVNFMKKKDFTEYLATLRRAENRAMCKNIKTFHREVVVSSWRPGEPPKDPNPVVGFVVDAPPPERNYTDYSDRCEDE